MKKTLALRVIGGILCTAVWTWATEPSPRGTGSTEGSDSARSVAADSPAPSPLLPRDSATESAPAVSPSPAGPAEAAGATPAQPANSANSVAASPYGAPTNEPAVPAQAGPPPPADDVPATLLDSGFYSMGGFGGFGVMYTRFAGGDHPLICGEGAVIIDHAFTLGGGGCGIPDGMKAASLGVSGSSPDDRLRFGYGGAIARYHFFSRHVTNLAVGVLIGAGGIVVGKWNGGTEDPDNFEVKNQDAVFIIEPQVAGFANLTRWLRVGAVAGLRLASGVDLKGMNASDLRGPTLGGQIQAGWF